jgi:hypothetical protein
MFMMDEDVRAAVATGDPENCKLLINERDDGSYDKNKQWKCLRAMAEDKKDDKLCDDIEDKHTQEYCYWDVAGVTGDKKICNKVYDKDRCYSEVAGFDNDPETCKLIEDLQDEKNCIFAMAARTGEFYCVDYKGEDYFRCTRGFARDHGVGYCDNLVMTEEQIAMCVTDSAKEVKDCGIMDRDGYPDDWDDCISKTAQNEGKATACMEINNVQQRKGCVKSVALKQEDPNACERLSGDDRDECFYEYGTYEDDPKTCKRISDSAKQAECMKIAE